MEKQFLIYDIEIEKAILGRNETPINGIKYCAGWDDQENMGISVLCAFDYQTKTFRVFTESNKDQFAELCQNRVVVGFNSRKFDDQVLKKVWGIDTPESIDILVGIWGAVGLGPDFNFKTHGGYGIDDCCSVNFGIKKTGHGALAPVDWQRGKIGDVIDYCINDVYMTKRLFDMIRTIGGIRNPKNPREFIQVNIEQALF